MTAPVFSFSGLCAGYGDVPVLHGIEADIAAGEFVAIIGPNGSGKSTLLKTLSGDITPSAGELFFMGERLGDVNKRSLASRRAVVHQFLEHVTPFTVKEFVMMGRFPHLDLMGRSGDRDRGAVETAVEQTGIGALLDRPITELSGGELQLVRIAAALAQNSGVILLDEPVSHLDMRHSLRIMDILFDLHRSGSTVVAVLHDINMASDYSSLVMGISGGKIAFYDPPDMVLEYQKLEELFGARCVTLTNPISGRPFNYPVPGHLLK